MHGCRRPGRSDGSGHIRSKLLGTLLNVAQSIKIPDCDSSSVNQEGKVHVLIECDLTRNVLLALTNRHAAGERQSLMSIQEVTPESFEMMRKSPWWGRYMSSPTLEQQSYDTAILYNKSQVTAAGPFQKQHFRNSIMGMLPSQLFVYDSHVAACVPTRAATML